MKPTVALVVRILLGISLVVFGLNKFLQFIPTPELEGSGFDLAKIYRDSGFIQMIGGLEFLGGISLLIKKFVPLALIVTVAILFNAVVFHVLHDPPGLGGAVFGLTLALLNVYFVKDRFSDILSA